MPLTASRPRIGASVIENRDDDRLRGTRRGWLLFAILASIIGLSAPQVAASHAAAPSATTEKPLVDADNVVGKGAVRPQSERLKPPTKSSDAPPSSPQPVLIARSSENAWPVVDPDLLFVRQDDGRAPTDRLIAQPRAPPASRV
jgi:hypothetical protein